MHRRQFLQTALVGSAVAASAPQATLAQASDDLAWTPGWRLRDMIAARALSPVELTEHMLTRIDRINPRVNAYVTVDREGARAQARAAEAAVMRGDALGPLHGLPISIKDLASVRGLRFTEGSLIYKDRIAAEDEIWVARLRAAGAVILGKTNTPEFGFHARTKTLVSGETFNPWDLGRVTGASSGGAGAAVASGMSAMAVSSDGGGSTRIPAAYNGVFGLQPSAGRLPDLVPTNGPPQASFGPTTLDVRDAAIMLNVMAGPDPRDPSAIQTPRPDFTAGLDSGVRGFRIAWSDDFGHIPIVDPRVLAVQRAAARRFEAAGARVDDPQIRFENFFDAWVTSTSALGSVAAIQGFTAEQRAMLSPPIARYFLAAGKAPPTAAEVAAAEQKRGEIRQRFDALFAQYDLICTPVFTLIAPPVPKGWDQPYADPTYARQFGTPYLHVVNWLGLTAASVPCGFVDGMPVGLHVIGQRMNETKVLRAAQAFAAMQPWSQLHPAVAV